jgi:hypothetical protein
MAEDDEPSAAATPSRSPAAAGDLAEPASKSAYATPSPANAGGGTARSYGPRPLRLLTSRDLIRVSSEGEVVGGRIASNDLDPARLVG